MELRRAENWSFVGYSYRRFKKENKIPENMEVPFLLNGKKYFITPKGQRVNSKFSVEAQFEDGEKIKYAVLAKSHSLAMDKFNNKYFGPEYPNYEIISITKL